MGFKKNLVKFLCTFYRIPNFFVIFKILDRFHPILSHFVTTFPIHLRSNQEVRLTANSYECQSRKGTCEYLYISMCKYCTKGMRHSLHFSRSPDRILTACHHDEGKTCCGYNFPQWQWLRFKVKRRPFLLLALCLYAISLRICIQYSRGK